MDSIDVSTQTIVQPGISSIRDPALPVSGTRIQSSAIQSASQCPSCGATLLDDQRYCLECGQRRGDPRLPFMDAVVLMEAVKRPRVPPPPPPKKKRAGISPNAALIAGVGTLLLALGIGVLIGRSGNRTPAATSQAPIVIKGGAGSSEEGSSGSTGNTTIGGGGGTAKTPKQKKALHKEAESTKGAEEVLKPKAGVKLPPAKIQPGGSCEKGTAGCQGGKFTGNFFGE
jgi:hypothetical protein